MRQWVEELRPAESPSGRFFVFAGVDDQLERVRSNVHRLVTEEFRKDDERIVQMFAKGVANELEFTSLRAITSLAQIAYDPSD